MAGPAAALVPVVIVGTSLIRMVGAPIASQLVKRGLVTKATAKQIKNFGKNIPKMTRQRQGDLTKAGARNIGRRTPMRGPGGRKKSQLEILKKQRENLQKGKNAPTSSAGRSRAGDKKSLEAREQATSKISNAANVVDKGAKVRDAVNKSTKKAAKKQKNEKALQAREKATQRSIAERIAQRKKAESSGKRNLPSTTRPVPARGTSGRPSATPANAAGRNLSTSINKPVAPRPRPKPDMKTVGSGNVPPRGTSGRPSATPANASGLRSLAAKGAIKPQIAAAGIDTKKPSKKNDPVGSGQTPASGYVESKPKPNNNRAEELDAAPGVTSGKKTSKFKDEGGKYKQYEWAKKLDPNSAGFQSGYLTKKGSDAQDEEDAGGAKKGGQIKKVVKNKQVVKKKAASVKSTSKKRNSFSGRGAGAALRGF